MKRLKKEKKAKKTGGRKWPLWLTLILVIAGVGVISGITVLGVYLAGGFEERVINPENITFSYDEELYNQATGQLEVVDDFTLTITTSTNPVTETAVTLSFPNISQPNTTEDDNGVIYIDNGIIQVPEVVTLGQPFTVLLIRDNYLVDSEGNEILDAYGQSIQWIVGGISTLQAESEYNMLSRISLQIAVDVPVYMTETVAINSVGETTNQIVTGEAFTLDTIFYPSKSEYIYSDIDNLSITEDNRRVKHAYYQKFNVDSSDLATRYDGRYEVSFIAGNQAIDNITLMGYTFQDAATQKAIENHYTTSEDELFYSQVLGYLDSPTTTTDVSSQLNIRIGAASVYNFTVSKAGSSISMNPDSTMRLYINQYLYDLNAEFLGVNVYSTSGAIIENMLSNIALSFEYNEGDPTIGNNTFLTVSGGERVEIDGTYYYMPFSNVSNLNYGYWDLLSLQDANINVSVVLLIETEDGGYSLFGTPSLIYEFTLSVEEHTESEISWADSSDINVMLNYNPDGSINPYTINLDELVSIPTDNIYKDYVFFAYFGEGEKDALVPTVDTIIGATGYNYNLTGYYSTDIDNLMLFAINGSTLTLQNTGTFRLYYATVVTENGIPVYEEDQSGNRTYRIAMMCNEYITVNCEKSLYQDSVQAGGIDTSAFQEVNGEIAINQGATQTISVAFRVNAESVSVFQEELDNNHISLIIRSTQNTDITSYFSIAGREFTVDGTTGEGMLEYQINVNTGMNIEISNGIYIYQFILNYNNDDDSNIDWVADVPVDTDICIYSPVATNIEIAPEGAYDYNNFITGQDTIYVNQILNASGNFTTTISLEITQLTSVSELLTRLLGVDNSYVTITDQKQRTDTLAGEWRFIIESGSTDAINLNGQTFTFRQAQGAVVSLALESIDGNATSLTHGQLMTLNISSVGITYAESTDSLDPFTNDNYTEEPDISNIAVSKYGAKSDGAIDVINLHTLARFYIGEDENRTQYNNIRFQFSQQYLNDSTITDEMIEDLFGYDGMLTLYSETGIISGLDGTAASIRAALSGQSITSILINKDFSVDHIIRFTISDTGENGAISSTLSLTLLPNVSVSSQNYPNNGETLYASASLELENTVTNNYLNSLSQAYDNSLASLYDDGESLYYIVRSGNNYILEESATSYVGIFYVKDYAMGDETISAGTIIFEDFWNEPSQTYSVIFAPDGDNNFTLSITISFVVTRDLAIYDQQNVYYIINSGTNYVESDFVSLRRMSTAGGSEVDTAITGIDVEYVFSDYLVYENGNITKSEDAFFVFDYNTTELTTTLYINYLVRGANNTIINRVELGSIEIKIRLYTNSEGDNFDLYEYIASLISYDSDYNIKAEVQNIGSTEYIMLQEGTWFLNDDFVRTTENNGFNIYGNLRTYSTSGNAESTTNYLGVTYDSTGHIVEDETGMAVSLTGTRLTTRNSSNRLFQGLDGEELFMVVYFGSDNENNGEKPEFPGSIAVMYVPIIISSIGFDYVNYESGVDNADKLATAMTEPNTLIENGIYDTVSAGQVTQILSEYTFGEELSNGLYMLSNPSFSISVDYYPVDTTGSVQANSEIEKLISIETQQVESGVYERVAELSLNHLTSTMDNFYLALRYTISNSSDSREFYYVLKVIPDVIVDNSVYGYNGNSEFLESDVDSENMVELDNVFGATTLNENQKRFNITKQIPLINSNLVNGNITIDSIGTEGVEGGEEQIITTLDVSVTSDMTVLITPIDGSDEINGQPQLITITTLDKTIDLTALFGDVERGDRFTIRSISGAGEIRYNETEINTVQTTITELQVIPDSEMQVWFALYNSNGELKTDAQFVTISEDERIIDLEEVFAEALEAAEAPDSTENFEIATDDILTIKIITGEGSFIYNGTRVFSDLSYVNEVESVVVGENPYFSEETWSNYIRIYFSDDYSQMYYTAYTSEQITINIKHSYQGGAQDDDLAVIGGEQYYTFILNTTTYNYSVRFEEGNSTVITDSNNEIYTWDITRESIASSDNRTLSMDIRLLEGYITGSAQSYTEVWDILQISMTGERAENQEIGLNVESAVESFTYDSSQANQGLFTITFANYISSDRQIEFTLYTEQGYLATLIINIDATASYDVKVDNNTLAGGNSYEFTDIFNIRLNGEETSLSGSDYTITLDSITSSTQDINGFDGTDFIVFDGNSTFIVADLIRSYNITLSFTITFRGGIYDGQNFTFTTNLTLGQNVVYRTSANGGVVLAGEDLIIDEDGIFSVKYSYGNTNVVYNGSSSSPAFVSIEGTTIHTDYIASDTSVDVNMIVSLYFNYNSNSDLSAVVYQTFTITFSFNVYKSVSLEANYPSPNGEELTREFIDDGTGFTNILTDFIFHKPAFNNSEGNVNRITIMQGEILEGSAVYNNAPAEINNENLSITVLSMANASVYSEINGDNVTSYSNYLPSSEIGLDENITFRRGTFTSVSGSNEIIFNDNGTDSYVTFRITYQEVSCDYTVYILTNSVVAQINYVSANIASGTYSDEGGNQTLVNYETIYVDKTSTDGLFSQNRMASVIFSNEVTAQGSYYVVFAERSGYSTDESIKFYASYPQYIDSSYSGQIANLDLGYSMANTDGSNFVYVGTYEVLLFEENMLTVGTDGIISKVTAGETITTQDATFADIRELANSDSNQSIFSSIALTNRIQLLYGGANGEPIAYSYYGIALSGFDFENYIEDTINFIPVFNNTEGNGTQGIDKDDGSTNNILDLSLNYYFMPSIDIAVDAEISSLYNYIELEVNYEIQSMVELFGVRHPTTGEYIIEGDFGADRATLTFESVNYKSRNNVSDIDENDTELVAILDGYISTYGIASEGFSIEANSDGTNRYVYLFSSAILNAGQYAYDYRLLPLGADNQGDFVLTRLTYSVPIKDSSVSYEKEFYIVVKIVPDYQITYGGNIVEVDTNSAVVSNEGNVYNIASLITVDGQNVYSSFTLTDSDSLTEGQEGHVSVRHTNGENTSVELATSNFTITMNVPGSTIEGVEYNNETNVGQKLGEDLNAIIQGTADDRVWIYDENSKTYTLREGQNTTFNSVKEVIFGTQYYYIEAVDPYGFTYILYFSLQSSYSPPEINADTIALTELGYLDFGAQYELLSVQIEEGGNNDSSSYYINAQTYPPEDVDGTVELIEITGIEAYLFSSDPTSITDSGLVAKQEGGYTIEVDENLAKWPNLSEDEEYFEVPMLNYISVDSIMFYDMEDNPIINSPIEPTEAPVLTGDTDTETQLSTEESDTTEQQTTIQTRSGTTGYTLATITSSNEVGGGETVFNGLTALRDPYRNPGSDAEQPNVVAGQEYLPFQVPRIENTDLFEESNTADAQMVVRLEYNNNGVIEYYDLKVNVTITREVSILEEEQAPVRDGEAFTLIDEFDIMSGGEDLENSDGIEFSFINDTLEVLVSGGRLTNFELYLYRDTDGDGEKERYNDTPAIVNINNTGYSWARTVYISISQYLRTNIKIGDELEIIPRDQNATFYYVYNTADDINEEIVSTSYYQYNVYLPEDSETFAINLVEDKTDNTDGSQTTDNETGSTSLTAADADRISITSIKDDIIYVENASLLEARQYYNVRKYYIVSIDFGGQGTDTPFNYRVSKNYFVTGKYYALQRESTLEIIPFVTLDGGEGSRTSTITKLGWGDAFSLLYANSNLDVNRDNPQDIANYTNYFTFTLDATDGASGNAEVDAAGTITFFDSFTYDQYIKIIIRMKVSGTDRDINNDSDASGLLTLGTLNLSWDTDYNG